MIPPFDYFEHRRICLSSRKQAERERRLSAPPYNGALAADERSILATPVSALAADIRARSFSPVDVLRAYGKSAVRAHRKTNCLTEILLPEAEEWVQNGDVNLSGPLAGVPVSLKDTLIVGGFDAGVSYTRKSEKPYPKDGPLVRILKDAGAVPFVKTNIPASLLSFESGNDLWGRTCNPYQTDYSAGGSSGGEGALIACGGSRIGVGSDVAGSVRIPAHYSGICAIRCSTGRFPKAGADTSMSGQEGVPAVCSPMARTVEDLRYFSKVMIGDMQPWKYDASVHAIGWRENEEKEILDKKKLRIGVMRTDGIVDPSPACERALSLAVSALSDAGHECFNVSPPPSTLDALTMASVLLNSDGCRTFESLRCTGEGEDSGAAQLRYFAFLPRPIRYLYYLWVRYVRRDPIWAALLRHFGPLSAHEQWTWVAKREAYKRNWHSWWNEQGVEEKQDDGEMDFLLTVPNATPAVPHGGMHDAVSNCGYTFLFNLVDYPAAVLPVTRVDKALDALSKDPKATSLSLFSTFLSTSPLRGLNGVARGAYRLYDAEAMHGLPVGVQLVARRLKEERLLAFMQRLQDALVAQGNSYQGLDLD